MIIEQFGIPRPGMKGLDRGFYCLYFTLFYDTQQTFFASCNEFLLFSDQACHDRVLPAADQLRRKAPLAVMHIQIFK